MGLAWKPLPWSQVDPRPIPRARTLGCSGRRAPGALWRHKEEIRCKDVGCGWLRLL
jgi:hypothetical protein